MTNPAPTTNGNGNGTGRRDGEATRQKLLRAALELYTSDGFKETTTPAIAERAGVAEGTIYRHFTSKEHLLNEAYRATFRWALGVIKEVEEADRTVRTPERLQRIGRRLVEVADRDAAAVRMLLFSREDRYLDNQSREVARQFRDGLQQVIASGKSDGLVRPGPAELWAGAWLALVAYAVEKVLTKEWNAEHPSVQQVLDAAWDAIGSRN
ncbi:MAG: TetR/AcrR family transcriptional regulator [Gemmatimonadales bacterium]|nr:TetR/AcrR family transcriptional regulator [Gemmatimonadales bacterium]